MQSARRLLVVALAVLCALVASPIAAAATGTGLTWGMYAPSLTVADIVQVSGGKDYSLALKANGTVWQSGSPPTQVPGLSNVKAIAAGPHHALALKTDGTVWAWGANTYGQLGDGSTTSSTTPLQVSGLTGVAIIAAGGYGQDGSLSGMSFAVKSDGAVWGWGWNAFGNLGFASATVCDSWGNGCTKVPTQITALSNVTGVAAGAWHSLFLKGDGTVWAAGWNLDGQLGNAGGGSSAPVQVTGVSGAIAVGAGDFHSLAVTSGGEVWAWGHGRYGQLGTGSNTSTHVAARIPGLSGVVAVDGGGYSSIALKSDGTVWTWGDDNYGELGVAAPETCVDGSYAYPCSKSPVQTGIKKAISASLSSWHGAAAAVPQIAVVPASLSFGSVLPGTTSASQSVTATNNGSVAVTITTVNLGGANAGDWIKGSGCAGATLSPGASCSIALQFKPTDIGSRSASLAVASNADGSPHSVSLAGTGSGLYRNKGDFVADAGTLTTVDFDSNACGSVISAPLPGVLAGSRYANAGVIFAAGVIVQSGPSASSPNVVSNTGVNTPTPALVDGTFATPVAAVGIMNVGAEAVLRVYDASGTLIASLKTDTSTAANDFVGILSAIPIKRFEFDFVSGLGFGGDDLLFTEIETPDCTPPTITAPVNITTATDSGTCGAVVTYAVSATDDVAVASLSSSPASGSTFPKGTTTVTVTATDTSGNTATTTFAVSVNDHEPPTLTAPPNVTTRTDAGRATATVNPGSASASDNCPAVTLAAARSDGQPLSAAYPYGTTTITWTATDASGNVTTAAQTVTVADLEPPTVTCPANITVDATSASGATVTYTASASDNVGVAATTFSHLSGSSFPIGTTTVAYTATDAAGNSATCSFTVTVKGVTGQLADLGGLVTSFSLQPQGIETSLLAKLQAALSAFNAGNTTTACQNLRAFINEVDAQDGKKLTPTQAQQLRDAANRVRAVIGCP